MMCAVAMMSMDSGRWVVTRVAAREVRDGNCGLVGGLSRKDGSTGNLGTW